MASSTPADVVAAAAAAPPAAVEASTVPAATAGTATAETADDATLSVALQDGRVVSYTDCGAPDGFPVLFFHPVMGNRYMGLLFHQDALALGLRVVAPDRPGFGNSTPVPNRTVRDYPGDVANFCKLLGISRFAAVAASAGSMYALACTLAPETSAMVVGPVCLLPPWIPPSSCCPAPPMSLRLAPWLPTAVTRMALRTGESRLRACDLHKIFGKGSAAENEAFTRDPATAPAMQRVFSLYGHNNDTAASTHEFELCTERAAPLGFTYANDIIVPVRVYVGSVDTMVVPELVQAWATHARTANVTVVVAPGGTHHGVGLTHQRECLEAVAQGVRGGGGGGIEPAAAATAAGDQ